MITVLNFVRLYLLQMFISEVHIIWLLLQRAQITTKSLEPDP